MAKTIPVDDVTDWTSALFQRLNNAVPTGENEDGSGPLLHGLSAGSSTAYTLTLTFNSVNFPSAAYVDGLMLSMRAHVAPGANPTLNTNAIAAKSIKRLDGSAVGANAWAADDKLLLIWDATADFWRWIGSVSDHDHSDAANGGDLGSVTADQLTIANDPGGTPDANTLYKASIPKGWIEFLGDGTTILGSLNVSSLTDTGAGDFTVNWDRDFANDDYAVAPGVEGQTGSTGTNVRYDTKAVGSVRITTRNDADNLEDADKVSVIAIGGQ